MNISAVDEIAATNLEITEDEITATLADGRRISVPLVWYPRLLHATDAARRDFRWIGNGTGIHWPQIDEDLSVRGFLFGWKAPQSR